MACYIYLCDDVASQKTGIMDYASLRQPPHKKKSAVFDPQQHPTAQRKHLSACAARTADDAANPRPLAYRLGNDLARDRLLLAKELLTESGSIFVQISDENLHHVREVMDEVFGSKNAVSVISFKKPELCTV